MLDRRSFLRRLGFGTVAAAAAATGVLDIERLLWVPGEKTIFIPEAIAANGFVTVDWLSMETMRLLKNSLQVSAMFNQQYDKRFTEKVARIRVPRRWMKMSVADA